MVGQQAQARHADGHWVAPHLWNGLSEVRVNCGTAVVGTPEQAADVLLGYWKLGFGEFILSGFPHVEECRRVSTQVLPLLREKIAAASGHRPA
jgi:alkanesulfonate monooxygenase